MQVSRLLALPSPQSHDPWKEWKTNAAYQYSDPESQLQLLRSGFAAFDYTATVLASYSHSSIVIL